MSGKTIQSWQDVSKYVNKSTGKSLPEALNFESINPQYDSRLFMVIPISASEKDLPYFLI